MKHKAAFIDRDGVLNKKPAPHDYVKSWLEFILLPQAISLVIGLNKLGYRVIVVTNQRGIARGLMSEASVREIHQKMVGLFKKHGARIAGVYFCPHHIEAHCACRKPQNGMLLAAARDFKLDLSQSIMIGDDKSDSEAGAKTGIKTIIVAPNTYDTESIIKAVVH